MGYKYNSPMSTSYRKPIVLDADDPNVVTSIDQEKFRSKIGSEIIVKNPSKLENIQLTEYTGTQYSNWIGIIPGTSSGSTNYNVYKVVTDTNGNIYAAGFESVNSQFIVTKYDRFGELQWISNHQFGTFFSSGGKLDLAIDSLNNTYLLVGAITVIKINSEGVFQWQKSLSLPTSYSSTSPSVAVDSSFNVYIAAYGMIFTAPTTYSPYIFLIKLNSTGTVLWQKRSTTGMSTSQNQNIGVSLALDSSNIPYISYIGTSNNTRKVVKFTTAGAVTWSVTTSFADAEASGFRFSNMAIDTTGNIYISGSDQSTASNTKITKLTSAGAAGWQLSYAGYPSAIDIDSLGNLYIITGQDLNPDIVSLIKTDSAGNVTYQRSLRETTTGTSVGLTLYNGASGIAINRYNQNINIAPTLSISTSGSAESTLISLPNDGTKTGTYAGTPYYSGYNEVGSTWPYSFTYATSTSISITKTTPTVSAAGITFADSFLTDLSVTISSVTYNPATETWFPNGILPIV